jgi:hypothetical protein
MQEGLAVIQQQYEAVPHTGLDSNKPYANRDGDPNARQQRIAAKREFLSGDQEWPNISYPNLDDPSLHESEAKYLRVLSGLVEHENAVGETPVSDALYESAARKLAEVYRHREVRRRLGLSAITAVETSRSHAAEMSAELFGDVGQSPFEVILAGGIRDALAESMTPTDPVKSRIAHEYLEYLGLTRQQAEQKVEGMDNVRPFELEDKTIEVLRDDLYALFPRLADEMTPFTGRTANTSPADAQPAFEAALCGFELTEKGWGVRLITGKHSADTDGDAREITYGTGRAEFTPKSVVTTPIHEAMHALRNEHSKERSDAGKVGKLPGALEFEEGFPVVMEQIISGVKRVPGEKYYMQLGLLKGMHMPEEVRTEQSFRTAYEIMWRHAALQAKGSLTDEKIATLQASTYGSVMRTTRGNARDNRDISYFDGAMKATIFLNETALLPPDQRIARLKWAFSGVFDPTNPDHAEIYGGDPTALNSTK